MIQIQKIQNLKIKSLRSRLKNLEHPAKDLDML